MIFYFAHCHVGRSLSEIEWRLKKRAQQRSTSHHITSQDSTAQSSTSHHGTSHHITARHITSQDITSQHITSQHSTSQDITSHHITGQHSRGLTRTVPSSVAYATWRVGGRASISPSWPTRHQVTRAQCTSSTHVSCAGGSLPMTSEAPPPPSWMLLTGPLPAMVLMASSSSSGASWSTTLRAATNANKILSYSCQHVKPKTLDPTVLLIPKSQILKSKVFKTQLRISQAIRPTLLLMLIPKSKIQDPSSSDTAVLHMSSGRHHGPQSACQRDRWQNADADKDGTFNCHSRPAV
jgi:hypothetical protein